ncbi:hypothetical protein [Bacillus thuringiensis]|uniref:hypothetical protein n=1 Tax=Bacillus thuringiensis TaxID=1428 RepID=UPI001F0A2B7A|nr:hypothetical protein [Bacillus thuringiensis]
MSNNQKHIEYVIETMDKRIQFLTDIIDVYKKKIEESGDYGRGLYEGSKKAHEDEINFLQLRIEALNRILELNRSSEEVI